MPLSTRAETVLREALALSEEERADMAELLQASLPPTSDDVAAAWDEELARRIERIERGEDQPVPEDEALARIEAMVREKR